MSIDDFVISYFTAGSASSTLAMAIYSMTKKKVTPEINAISTLLFVTVLVSAGGYQHPGGPAGAQAGRGTAESINVFMA